MVALLTAMNVMSLVLLSILVETHLPAKRARKAFGCFKPGYEIRTNGSYLILDPGKRFWIFPDSDQEHG
jgi:hypothetical protein